MSQPVGPHTMVGRLKRVIVKRPRDAFGTEERIGARWRELGYVAPPSLEAAEAEHDHLVAILESVGAEVLFLGPDERTGLDSIYTHDPALVTSEGVILLRMGKAQRRGETAALEQALEGWGVPVHGRVDGEATAEGGDLLWLDETTLVVGRSYRTNRAGCDRLTSLLDPLGVRVVGVDLPHWNGSDEVLHLLSLISPVDRDLVVVYPRLLPVALVEMLDARKVVTIEVPEAEFASQGTNVLALAPRHALVLEGNPRTREALEAAGCRVEVMRGNEISLKGMGGPTCLTRPILREAGP